jgi:hypothetical protein
MKSRIAYAVVHDSVLVLGDPNSRANHLRVTPSGIVARYGNGISPDLSLPWAHIESIQTLPPHASCRLPTWASIALATAAGAIGFEWQPSVADVDIHIISGKGATRESLEFSCTGYVGRGYAPRDCKVIQTALNLLIHDENTRTLLTDPQRFIAEIAQIANTE